MFKYTDKLLKQIVNKGDLSRRDLGIIEMALKLWELYDEALTEHLNLSDDKDIFKLVYKKQRPRI